MASSHRSIQVSENSENNEPENPEIQAIIDRFSGLRECSKNIENSLRSTEHKSIKVYMKEREMCAAVQQDVDELNERLGRMQNTWIEMENNLSFIHENLTVMQDKSIAMSRELTERQVLKGQLIQLIKDIDVADQIHGIGELKVNDKLFLPRWLKLNHDMASLKRESFNDTESYEVIKKSFAQLRLQAFHKIQKFLMDQLLKFHKPKTNIQFRQDSLLKYKGPYEFLYSYEKNMAQEIANEYINIMKRQYYTHIVSYFNKLLKVQCEETVIKNDLMGKKDTRMEIFSVNKRESILDKRNLKAYVIIPKDGDTATYSFEVLFRSMEYCLFFNACRELKFIKNFFLLEDPQMTLNFFNGIMEDSLNFLEEGVESSVSTCHDSITVFLCYQITQRYKKLCFEKSLRFLDPHWNTLESIFLARFSYIIHLNMDSIRDCDLSDFDLMLGPHFVTKRFTEYASELYAICAVAPNKALDDVISELQQEVELLIARVALLFPNRKDQLIFIINNYDRILCRVMELTGNNSKESEMYNSRIASNSSEYAEQALHPYFTDIVDYATKYENFLKRSQIDEVKALESSALPIVKNFNSNWKQSMKDMTRDVLLSFPNSVTANVLLQITIAQFLNFFNRFHMVLDPKVRMQLASVQVIMEELEKYQPKRY